MERENRYMILKLNDVEKLTEEKKQQLCAIASDIYFKRMQEERGLLVAVVVESDWPEYEKVWGMIQRRVEGKSREDRQYWDRLDHLQRYSFARGGVNKNGGVLRVRNDYGQWLLERDVDHLFEEVREELEESYGFLVSMELERDHYKKALESLAQMTESGQTDYDSLANVINDAIFPEA